jgi:hypothetical protein
LWRRRDIRTDPIASSSPSPDFALSISPASPTISQGAASSSIQISVQALHGFSGDVQITLGGIPAGITSNPQRLFTVTSGGALVIGAAATAATGTASISVQAASSGLSHAGNIALTIPSGSATIASRTTYARTDAQAASKRFSTVH